MKYLNKLLFTLAIFALLSFDFDKAPGWFEAGSKPESYEMGIDKGAGQDGKNCASIKSIEKKLRDSVP